MERGRRLAESVAAGRRIAAVECADDPIVYARAPAHDWKALRGRRVRAACRWGKQLWFDLDVPPHPLFHFGMSGGFRVPGDTPLQLASGPVHRPDEWPPRYWKVRLTFDDGGELVMTDARRLGRLLLREAPREEPPVSRLGFDPLLALPPPPPVRRAPRRPYRGHQVAAAEPGVRGRGRELDPRTKSSTRPASIRGGGRGTSTSARRSAFAPCSGGVVEAAVAVDAESSR